jgi:hypothetical protein
MAKRDVADFTGRDVILEGLGGTAEPRRRFLHGQQIIGCAVAGPMLPLALGLRRVRTLPSLPRIVVGLRRHPPAFSRGLGEARLERGDVDDVRVHWNALMRGNGPQPSPDRVKEPGSAFRARRF